MSNPPPSPRGADQRLTVAVGLALLFHGSLLAAGSHRETYDAYVHRFFADHYQRDWFSTWEPRWYTGFPTISYPPGTHQLLALAGRAFGDESGYVLVQLSAVLLLVVGVYRFANAWAGRDAAGWAAIAAAMSSSLAEVVHVFGQLPTTAALAFLLNAQPSIKKWITEGRRRDLLSALALLAATTSVHHVTTLFGSVFFTGPMVVAALLEQVSTPLDHEVEGHTHHVSATTVVALSARRLLRVSPAMRRTFVLGVATISLLIVVVLPYWLWSSSDPIAQVPIPHGSRDNFIENLNTGLVFWLVPWSSTLLLLPAALLAGCRRATWPLAASVLLLTVLGTGGTTPIPRLLLGGAFDILTLDRFTIWATVAILPFVGIVVERLVTAPGDHLLIAGLHRKAPAIALAIATIVMAGSTIFASSLTNYRPTQPAAIDPDPIVAFMERDGHDQWRYLMLGFGDQMANVSARTTALTVDGNYHSARRLPELTSHSVERLEGAKFRGVAGLGSLQEFIGTPARYNLKFVFSNDAFYDPMLWAAGWQRIGSLDNGIIMWERADIPPLLAHESRPEIPSWQRLMWGILPMSAIAGAGLALASIARSRPSDPPIRRWSRTDRFLLRFVANLDNVALGSARVRYGLRVTPARRRTAAIWTLRASCAVLVGTSVMSLHGHFTADPATPTDVVEQYYDHLDFQRFDQAWLTLDADTRPTLEDYLTGISVQDGLVAGYAKLESIDVVDSRTDGDRATVDVELDFLTSVETLRRSETIELRLSDRGWGVVLPPPPPTTTPVDPLQRTQTTDYQLDTTAQTVGGLPTIADRPQLRLGPTRAVTIENQWYVLGEVTNIDDRPAMITVDITALDGDGSILATTSASSMAGHTARPGETVPFIAPVVRVISESEQDATPAVDFDPDDDVSTTVGADPASFSVAARAVVATRGLDRSLQITSIAATTSTVDATLVNAGPGPITIPRMLVATSDLSGSLAWVESHWIETSVGAGQRVTFDTSTLRPENAVDQDIPIEAFADEISSTSELAWITAGGPGSSVAFHLDGFVRTEIE